MNFSRLEKSAQNAFYTDVNHSFKALPDRWTALSGDGFFNHDIPKTELPASHLTSVAAGTPAMRRTA